MPTKIEKVAEPVLITIWVIAAILVIGTLAYPFLV